MLPSTLTVNGTATDGTSHGVLPNIAVQITDGANAGKSAQTDGTGNYSIGGVPPGTFTMSAAAFSYETTTSHVTVSANTRVDFVLQRVAPSCSFTVSPLHLSFTHGGFPVMSGIVVVTASAPACTWTATNDPNDWLSMQVHGSGDPRTATRYREPVWPTVDRRQSLRVQRHTHFSGESALAWGRD